MNDRDDFELIESPTTGEEILLDSMAQERVTQALGTTVVYALLELMDDSSLVFASRDLSVAGGEVTLTVSWKPKSAKAAAAIADLERVN